MAFPVTGVLDDFNRADAITLGANWSNISGAAQDGGISSNQAYNPDASNEALYWNVAQYGADCEAYLSIPVLSASNGVSVRARLKDVGGSGSDGYELYVTFGGNWEIYEITNGTGTKLGSTVAGGISATDQIGISLVGSTIKGYRNGSEILSRTDGTWGASGYIGIYLPNSSIVRLENFGGGTIVAAAKAPPPFQKHTNYVWNRRN